MARKNLRIKTTAILMVAASMIFAGCGSSYDKGYSSSTTESYYEPSYEYEAMSDSNMMYEESAGIAEAPAETVAESSATNSRKLIKTVNMTVETREYDTYLPGIENAVNQMGGYIEDMYAYNGNEYSYRNARYSNITARIPKMKLDEFLNTVGAGANVVSKSESVEDITLTYVDVESRKEAYKVEQDRLLELMMRAESIDDILVIESRLSEIRYQLGSIESQLRTYDNKVDYSTVYLNIQEVKTYTPVEVEKKTIAQRISEGFVESLTSVWDGVVEFFIWFVIHIPQIIVWIISIVVIVWLCKIIFKGSKARAQKRAEKKAARKALKEEKKAAKLAAKAEEKNE